MTERNSVRNWCPIAPGSQICATWVAPDGFATFAASWPVQSGSRSFLEGALKKCDLGCATRVALFLKWASFYEFPRTSRVAGLRFDCKWPWFRAAATCVAQRGSRFGILWIGKATTCFAALRVTENSGLGFQISSLRGNGYQQYIIL